MKAATSPPKALRPRQNKLGAVSTTAARWQDWERVVKICLDNREADIDAFIRRHLSTLNLQQLGALLQTSGPPPTPSERAMEYLDYGRKRLADEC
jgi:hypothetical protein